MADYTYDGGEPPSAGSVTVPEPLSVDDNNSSLTVDGTVAVSTSGLPTGAATSALQTTGNTSLASLVTNTSGLATSALQTTGNTSLATIATNTTSIATAANQTTANTSLSTLATNSAAPAAIFSGKTTVTTAGSRVPLASTQALKKGVMLRASTANTGLIYVGTAAGVSSSVGYELAPGECLPEILPVADLASVGLDSSVNSQSVTYIAS